MRTRIPILLVTLFAAALPGAGSASAAAACPQFVRATARSLPAVVAAARAAEPNAELVGVLSLGVDSLGSDDVWRRIATARCGKRAAGRSWVVFYLRPHSKKNPAFADGVSYVARTPGGFRVWYRYR